MKKFVGLSVRTINSDEFAGKGKISGLWDRFMQEDFTSKISHKTNPTELIGLYSDYESDENGYYNVTVGFEVDSFDDQPEECNQQELEDVDFAEFESDQGVVPDIVIGVWKDAWAASQKRDITRSFQYDKEVYDMTADPKDQKMKLLISIK